MQNSRAREPERRGRDGVGRTLKGVSRAAVCPTLLLATLALPAQAQIQVVGASAQPDGFRIGPIRLQPTLAIRNIGVDNNVFNSSSGRRTDNTFVFAPGLRAYWPVGERIRLVGRAGLDIAYFARESEERYVDSAASGDIEIDVGPLMFFGGGGGGNHRSRFTIEIDERVKRHIEHARAGLLARIGSRARVAFEASTDRETYDEATAQNGDVIKRALDRRNVAGSVELRYRITHKTTLVTLARRDEDEFTNDPTPNEAQSYLYLGGLELSPKALMGGAVLFGARVFPPTEQQVVPVHTGLAYRATIERRLTWFALAEVLALRDIEYSVYPGNSARNERNSYEYSRVTLRLSFALPKDVVARSAVGYERSDYLLPVEQAGASIDRVDRRVTLQGALLWPVGKHLRVGGTVTWAQRRSNFQGIDYRGASYGITAELRQ